MLSLKNILVFYFTVLCSLFSVKTFAQAKKVKASNKVATMQKTDTIKLKGFYACTAYFSGNGLPYVRTANYSNPDINFLMKRIDSASNGAIVTIDDLRFISADGKVTMITQIPYNFNKSKDAVTFKSKAVLQVDELKSYNFVSGTIYFSGFGHLSASFSNANDTAKLNKYYARCGPGTTIILDNCVYKNKNGSLSSPLNKSIRLE